MSFTEPLSITVGGVTSDLPRTNVGDNSSVYSASDGLISLTASHNYAKRERRMLRVDTKKITADPFRPAENNEVSMSYYIVFDTPKVGYTDAEALAVYTGSQALFSATSNLMITKLLGGES